MLTINGIKYTLDTNAIMEFIGTPIATNYGKNVKPNSEITEFYSRNVMNEYKAISREVRELKLNSMQVDSIKYDYIKLLLEEAFTSKVDVIKLTDLSEDEEAFLGSALAINTLIDLKILINE